jgi:hypothetical protein
MKIIKMQDKILTFVSEELGIEKSKLSMNSKIEDDFGIAGLDTILFYERFFEKFEINDFQDFNINRHVTSERLIPKDLVKILFSKKYRTNNKTKQVTLRHLSNVAAKKIWHDEP